MIEECRTFGTEDGPDIQLNGMYQALHHAAGLENYDNPTRLYDWIEDCPRASMTIELVDALHECGFKIIRNEYTYEYKL